MSMGRMTLFDAQAKHLIESPLTSRYFPSDEEIYTVNEHDNELTVCDKILDDRNKVRSLAVIGDDGKVIGGLRARNVLLYIHERLDYETGMLKEEYGGGPFDEHMESVTARDLVINTIYPMQPGLCHPIRAKNRMRNVIGAMNALNTDHTVLLNNDGGFMGMGYRWKFSGLLSKIYPFGGFRSDEEYLVLSDKPPYVTKARTPKSEIKGLLTKIATSLRKLSWWKHT